MKNTVLILITSILLSCKSQSKNTGNEIYVLFIGNSLTYFHNMPQTLQEMVNETNPNIKIEQSTFPGMPLNGHLSEIITSRTENEISTRNKRESEKTETEKKIAEKKWDIIVLQTGSVSVLIPENREFKINKAISDIKKIVANPRCKFILFNTWPSKDRYPKEYCYPAILIDKSIEKSKCCSPIMENLRQEVNVINKSYETLAKDNNLIKSSNGTKFFEVITKYPEIELYDDDSHPSKYGSFLNACIFYQMLTGKKASELTFNGGIEPEKAKLLKYITDK